MTEPDKCKKRFKGIENFLRRVAYNLGNTPSQTEVKIISCIPIDVTDLQKKIIYLEKQLEEGKAAESTAQPNTAEQLKKVRQASVHTAIGTPRFSRTPKSDRTCKEVDYKTSQPSPEDTNAKRSLVSFIFPTYSNADEYITLSREQLMPEVNEECAIKQNKGRINFLKKKKPSNKKKVKTQLVYYAQTDNNSPLKNYIPPLKHIPNNEILSRSYLSNMVRKQYKPTFIDGLSDFGQFTAPICRDTDSNDNQLCTYESDMCSCCYGPFHNTDTHISNKNNVPSPLVTENSNRNAYYDSSLYDLVPVKDKPCKINRDPQIKREKIKLHGYTKFCPPVNYHTMSRTYLKKKQMKIHNRRDVTVNRARKQRHKNKIARETSEATSKSCSLDLGEIYTKPFKYKTRSPKKMEPLRKDEECLTTSLTKIECQTATSNTIEVTPTPREDKTEVTLNQIKAILQSVLIEVKTNNQAKDITQVKSTKDAVVQNGTSQCNMQGASSLLNSFTCSPYSMNPYLSSCSRDLPPNQYFYNSYNGSLHPKCLQNYPLFIQTPGRHVCASCYRNSSHVAKPVNPKCATTAATNTGEICEERSKETEKLIKEIYKSMALTMDFPAKDTSLSECDDLRSTLRDSTDKSINISNKSKAFKKGPETVSEPIRKKDNQISQFALQINAKSKSKTISSPASRRSREMSTDTDVTNHRNRKEIIEKNINTRNKEILQSTGTEFEAQDLQQPSTMASISDNETETATSETDSDDTYVPAKGTAVKKEKKGLFSKFKSVFKSKKKQEIETEESDVSDSDDYQTIYSQKVNTRAPSHRVPNTPRKPHLKVMHSKKFHQRARKPEKSKRSPYMEQEYRRYWNEKLMFHENQKREYSSEKPYLRETNPRFSPRPEYYRNYDARSVLVEPRRQIYHPNLGAVNARNPQPRIDCPHQNGLPMNNNIEPKVVNVPGKGLSWLKKHKMDIRCGDQWKKILLEG